MAAQTIVPVILAPDGAACERCDTELVDRLASLNGVASVVPEPQRQTLILTYDPATVSLEELDREAQAARADVEQRFSHDVLPITGMDCGECALTIEQSVRSLDGVMTVDVSFATARMRVEYASDRVTRADIVRRVSGVGYMVEQTAGVATIAGGLRRSMFQVTGMDCADCAVSIERSVRAMQQVRQADVSFASARLTVEHDAGLEPGEISAVVDRVGYGAVPEAARREQPSFWRRHGRVPFTAGAGVLLLAGVAASALGLAGFLATVLFGMSIAVGGYHIARAGIFVLTHTRKADINLLLAIAVAGAAALGDWAEAATVVFLFSAGALIESYTMDRARNAVQALMTLAPNTAQVRRTGQELTLPVEEVLVGDTVTVRPGERIPMDGVVTEGSSTVDQAPVTGESVPVEKEEGAQVFAGTLNQAGYLEVQVTKPYRETTLAKIIHLVEEAHAQRAPSQRFVDRFASRYTPAVIGLAALVALVPPLLFAQPWDVWIYRSLVMLLVACPCALVVSTPVAIVSAIANAARAGALIKGGVYLEEAGALRVVAFDKTGTLTPGRPEVTDVIPLYGHSTAGALRLAAALEARSEHPLAKAVVRRARAEVPDSHSRVTQFQVIPGKGVRGEIDGSTYHLGSPRLIEEIGIQLGPTQEQIERFQQGGKTVLVLVGPEGALGLIALADQLRPQARDAVRDLHAAGVQRVVMLTGDNAQTARAIADQVGIDDYRADLLPNAKSEAVQKLMRDYGKLAMVGDGVNDAPALANATVGIAMGTAGTDVALETADIALMADDLTRVGHVIRLSRATLATMRVNIILSIATKLLFMALVIPGFTTLWLAIFADVGTSLIVTAFSVRLLRYRQRELALRRPSPVAVGGHDHVARTHASDGHEHEVHVHAARTDAGHRR